MRIPERPRPTLDRSGFVNGTVSGFRVEESAVSVSEFGQGYSPADDSSMKQADLSNGLIEIFRDLQKFVIRYPDDSRGTCTTVSALSARKLQPIFEPWA